MPDVAKTIYPPRGHNNPEALVFSGRFALSTAPAIVAGRAYTVTYAATGLFTITTGFSWAGLVGGGLYVMSATLTDDVQLVSFNVATRALVLQFQSASAADAGTTAKQIGFSFSLQQKGLALK